MKTLRGAAAVIVLLLICAAGWFYAALRLRFHSVRIEGLEVPGRVELGREFPLTLSVLPRATIPPDAGLFIHFKGARMAVNADVTIPIPMRRWMPGKTARLGPFRCAIPAGAEPGRYEIEAGFFYYGRDHLGREGFVRIPWANRGVRDWTLGAVEAVRTPPRLWTTGDFGGRGYAVGHAGPLDKVFPGKGDYRGPVTDRVSLSAARNEFESFQLVVVPGASPLQGVTIETEDLRGPGVIKKDQITVRSVEYVSTRQPYYNVPRTGPWPDPLLPLDEGGVDVPRDHVQPFWVTVFVPPGTPAGDYRGRITVAPEGLPRTAVDLGLRVWAFELPATPTLKTGFDFYEYLVRQYYPKRPGESETAWRARIDGVCRDYYMDMIAHRISPIHNVGNPSLVGIAGGNYLLDFGEFDRRVEEYLRAGQTDFGIAAEARIAPDEGIWTDDWYWFTGPDAVRGVFSEYGTHLAERGWLGRAYTYIIDESYRGVKSLTRIINEGHPGIRTMLTCTPEEGYPGVDIWCVRVNNFDPGDARRFRDRGKELWLYVASPTRQFPTIILDGSSLDVRVLQWICRRIGVTGLMYWCVNYWHLSDPWKDPMTWPDQNWNVALYYPGPAGPVGSIRIEVLRDGMEDYEYLRMAEELPAEGGMEGLIREVASSTWEYSREPEQLLRARDAIGARLDAAAASAPSKNEERYPPFTGAAPNAEEDAR